MSDSNVLRLSAADLNVRERVSEAVDAVLAGGQSAPWLAVRLTGETLPAPVVAALVAGLRRVREVGGAIVVTPETRAIDDALRLHGLDRVFALPLDADAPPPGPRQRAWRPRRAAAATLLAVVFSALGWAPARAQQVTVPATADAGAILERVIERNPELSSYQGRMHVDLKLTSFPFLREHLDGTTYYKRPANYEVVFDRLPSYARGFEKLYTDIGDASKWSKNFVITVLPDTPYHNRADITLHLVQRVRGMIDHETVLIDPSQWTIDQIRYDYYNGGHITMSQEFRDVGGYELLSTQTAEIAIPHVRAIADGHYDDYQTNVALDDTLFTRKN